MPKKLTAEEFIERARAVHGDKYDYRRLVYTNSTDKLEIVCPIHGSFFQKGSNHTHGWGCAKCGLVATVKKSTCTTQGFINKAQKVHSHKHTYDEVIYVNAYTKIRITCPTHGIFEQSPTSHLSGKGCPLCRNDKLSSERRSNTPDFIEKAVKIHGNRYTYENTHYGINAFDRLEITCPIHGAFMQRPNHHLAGAGCPVCVASRGEVALSGILDKHKVPCVAQYTDALCRNEQVLYFDFGVFWDEKKSSLRFLLEFDGPQHYEAIPHFGGEEALAITQKRDAIKTKYCIDNNIKLIRIPYWEIRNMEDIIIKELV